MSNLNLGTAAGFATATLSNISGTLNLFTGLNQDLWDIEEAAYGHGDNLVPFHIFKTSADFNAGVSQVQDTLSRRVVPFEFPYVDGQNNDDLGRHGQNFDFDVIIHGDNYYRAFLLLVDELNDPRPGTLVHPVRGRLTVKFKDATITHQSAQRKAVALRIRFVEHNFEISFKASKPSTKSALATAVGFISTITNIVNKVESNIEVLTTIRNSVIASLTNYKDAYTITLVSLNTTFNSGSSADIPGLLPNNSASGTAFPSAQSPTDPFAGLSPAQIQSQQSPALASLQAIDKVTALRNQLTASIILMEGVNNGQGSLIFYDDILSLKQSSIAIQKTLELGLQSSKSTIKIFTVPILMSLREVCFANGLSPDRAFELETLNPNILSANFIEAGNVLMVPTS